MAGFTGNTHEQETHVARDIGVKKLAQKNAGHGRAVKPISKLPRLQKISHAGKLKSSKGGRRKRR